MVRLKKRYDNDRLQVLCVAEDGKTHLWVTIFDLRNYFDDELQRKMSKDHKEETLENLGKAIKGEL